MDADTLRLLLIVAGGSLLIGLYGWERLRARSGRDLSDEDEAPAEDKHEPRLTPWSDKEDDEAPGYVPCRERHEPPPALEPPPAVVEPEPIRSVAPVLLSLHIMPKEGVFTGRAIVHAASRCGIGPGDMGIYSRHVDAGSGGKPWFHVANLVEPGTFPFGAMAEFESPGLTLFLQAQGGPDDPARLQAMLTTARCLAVKLEAEIRDETRNPLTPEGEERLQDRVHELMGWRLTDLP